MVDGSSVDGSSVDGSSMNWKSTDRWSTDCRSTDRRSTHCGRPENMYRYFRAHCTTCCNVSFYIAGVATHNSGTGSLTLFLPTDNVVALTTQLHTYVCRAHHSIVVSRSWHKIKCHVSLLMWFLIQDSFGNKKQTYVGIHAYELDVFSQIVHSSDQCLAFKVCTKCNTSKTMYVNIIWWLIREILGN
jgi:hypothetical protein